MPIHHGKDKDGYYYQWGNQTKYYYHINNVLSEKVAIIKAKRQESAIYAKGYKKKYI
jgi:hypothetical protein